MKLANKNCRVYRDFIELQKIDDLFFWFADDFIEVF
jgi:hypothetical protein